MAVDSETREEIIAEMHRTGRVPEKIKLFSRTTQVEKVVVTITDGDTTPTVSVSDLLATANTSSTTITDFDDGSVGQIIDVFFGDVNTIIDFTGTNLTHSTGVDWSPTTGDAMRCVYDGTTWYCITWDTVGGSGTDVDAGTADFQALRWDDTGADWQVAAGGIEIIDDVLGSGGQYKVDPANSTVVGNAAFSADITSAAVLLGGVSGTNEFKIQVDYSLSAGNRTAAFDMDISGIPAASQPQIEFEGSGEVHLLGRSFTFLTDSMYQDEATTDLGDIAGKGQWWVRDDATQTPMFTSDDGTQFELNASSASVSASGTPVDNQLAIWTAADTIEGHADLTWDGTGLSVDGAGGVSVSAGQLAVTTGQTLRMLNGADTAWMDFTVDADFNIDTPNLADIDITGFTSIQAGTVDADFDALTATSVSGTTIGGITEADLVDKSASETIPGQWEFSGAGGISVSGGQLAVTTGQTLRILNGADTAWADFLVDADFNITTPNLADIDITGFTSIQAGTVDADFDAITATSYGGIVEGDLVSKAAIETITAAWTFSGNNTQSGGRLLFADSIPLYFGTGQDVSFDFNAGNLATVGTGNWNISGFTSINAGTIDADFDALSAASATGAWDFTGSLSVSGGQLAVTTGQTFRMLNGADTAWMDFTVDTDFNITTPNLADIDITGFTSIQAGTVDADFDAITATSYGGIPEAGLVDGGDVETISGLWSFSGNNVQTGGSFRYNDSVSLFFGAGSDVEIDYENANDRFRIDLSTTTDFILSYDAETALWANPDGGGSGSGNISLYANGLLEVRTQLHTETGNTSGAFINDHVGTSHDIGFNVLPPTLNPASFTLAAEHCGHGSVKTNTTAITITCEGSGTTDFPVGGVHNGINGNTNDITIADGSTDLILLQGGSATDVGADCTVGVGGMFTIYRVAAGTYYIWGSEITV